MSKILKIKNYLTSLYQKNWWLTPVTIFLVWRIFLECTGQYFYWHSFPNPFLKDYGQDIWWRWDSNWYSSIVQKGYILKVGTQSNVTFFPLYPLLWKAMLFVSGLRSYASAILVSNILTLGSFIIFYRWLYIRFGSLIARRGLVALVAFPTSFFLTSVYSESTFLILVCAIFLLVEQKSWKQAALVALLASAARPVGIFLWPTLLYLWWAEIKDNQVKNKFDFFCLFILPPLGLIFFSLYLWYRVGDPLAWLHGQINYGRNMVSPIKLLFAYGVNIATLEEAWWRHLMEISALFFAVACIPRLKKLHPAYVFYIILNLLPSLFSNTLTSIQRFILVLVPLFIVVAKQKNIIYYLYLFISLTFLIFSISQFVILKWAG